MHTSMQWNVKVTEAVQLPTYKTNEENKKANMIVRDKIFDWLNVWEVFEKEEAKRLSPHDLSVCVCLCFFEQP